MTLTFLVTRPNPAGEALCQLIRAQGDHAIHCPTIAFKAPCDKTLFLQSMEKLPEQDWIIWISPQAVYATLDSLQHLKDQLREVKLASIGAGTANILIKAGFHVAAYPKTQANSENLLALPPFQSIKDKKIAIIRGEGGRDYLEKTLTQKGAHVFSVVVYERILPTIAVESYITPVKQKMIDAIICSSGEGVSNLKHVMGIAMWEILRDIPLIVVSERIKILAQRLGFQTIWVARDADHDALVEIIRRNRNVLCQKKQMKS